MRCAIMTVILALSAAPAQAQWMTQASRSTASLRGVHAVSARVAWASGSGGTVLRTVDGGRTWTRRPVAGGDSLDFRSVWAGSADVAYIASAGEGEKGLACIYKTRDGGRTWRLQYQDSTPGLFLDGLAFWSARHGLAFSDPVGGRFVVLTTRDGGDTWTSVPPAAIPAALPGEAAFAASGRSVVAYGARDVWIGSGGAARARVFHSGDRGATWTVAESPIRAGSASSGIFALAFRSERDGAAVGGDYRAPDETRDATAVTGDAGRSWTAAGAAAPGSMSGLAYRGHGVGALLVGVGDRGTGTSRDDGRTWVAVDTIGFHSVSFAGDAGWAVGAGGRIARWRGPAPAAR